MKLVFSVPPVKPRNWYTQCSYRIPYTKQFNRSILFKAIRFSERDHQIAFGVSYFRTVAIQMIRFADQVQVLRPHDPAIANKTSKTSHSISTPTESKKINFITRLIRPHKKFISILDIPVNT